MRSPIVLGAFLALLTPAGVLAQRADLPPVEKVAEALDNHPSVAAARARVDAARADRDMLAKGSHEIAVAGSYVRRSVDREGGYDEFDATISRPFRLPGKAALDRRSEEHTSELQARMRISYAVFCLKKKKDKNNKNDAHKKDRGTTGVAHTTKRTI